MTKEIKKSRPSGRYRFLASFETEIAVGFLRWMKYPEDLLSKTLDAAKADVPTDIITIPDLRTAHGRRGNPRWHVSIYAWASKLNLSAGSLIPVGPAPLGPNISIDSAPTQDKGFEKSGLVPFPSRLKP
jgi:hypothetical protein